MALHQPQEGRAGEVLLTRRTAMKLSWFRRSKITVEVLDDEILVTMPGTSFSIVYEKNQGQSAHRQLLFCEEGSGRKT